MSLPDDRIIATGLAAGAGGGGGYMDVDDEKYAADTTGAAEDLEGLLALEDVLVTRYSF